MNEDTELEENWEEDEEERDFYVPTLEEIRLACLEVQATWDEQTRISRIADYTKRPDYSYHWEVPVIKVSELGQDMEGAIQQVVDIGEGYAEYSQAIDVTPDTEKGPIRIIPNVDRIKII